MLQYLPPNHFHLTPPRPIHTQSFLPFLGGIAVCFIAGFSGALAAVFGKLSGDPQILAQDGGQILCYVLLIACNGLMLTLYSKSLSHTPSLQATVATLSSNILFTGQLGKVVFGEKINLSWWVGASTILLGSYFIRNSSSITSKAAAKGNAVQMATASPPKIAGRRRNTTRRA
jgi:drug/metabolite transporter (DMT)-like permease